MNGIIVLWINAGGNFSAGRGTTSHGIIIPLYIKIPTLVPIYFPEIPTLVPYKYKNFTPSPVL
jgi:hypothetical protein